ncbi:RuvC-like resolvase [Rhodobacter phage RcKickapoo]|nr:RuvC-like resolvase [Rhodobacter phage RcKickapoo]
MTIMKAEPRHVVGLDPSMTSFGFAELNTVSDGRIKTQAFITEPADGSDMQRIRTQYARVIAALDSVDGLSMAAIEGYGPLGRTAGKITQRAELIGMIKLRVLDYYRVPLVIIGPQQLKKYATGNAKAKKDEVMQNCAREGHIAQVSDEADAYFLAKFARLVYTGARTSGISYETIKP